MESAFTAVTIIQIRPLYYFNCGLNLFYFN